MMAQQTSVLLLHFQLLLLISIFLLLGLGRSDFASDQAECSDSLVGLAPCLEYVSGEAKAPVPDCCKSLQQVVDKNKKCLCVLVKDRDNPQLGFKVNATRTLTLPTTCKTKDTNITACIDLLHLSASSPEAQIFKQYGSSSTTPSSPAKAIGTSNSSSSTGGGSTANEKSSGARERIWVFKEILMGVIVWYYYWV